MTSGAKYGARVPGCAWFLAGYIGLSGCSSTHAPARERDQQPGELAAEADAGSMSEDSGAQDAALDAGPGPAASPDAAAPADPPRDAQSDDCVCSRAACPEGSERVLLPDACCPVCRSCAAITCPVIACAEGLEPLLEPGQCCALACKRPAINPNHYGAITLPAASCVRAPRPSCNGNGWPHCAVSWEQALSDYHGSCPGVAEPYLARCDQHNAIVTRDEYSTRVFLFDLQAETLVGQELIVDGKLESCLAYAGDFAAIAEACQPLTKSCTPEDAIAPADAGVTIPWATPPLCSEGQAAYDKFLMERLDTLTGCSTDGSCGGGFLPTPNHACAQPCELLPSLTGINSQVLPELASFGRAACARCAIQPPCPPQLDIGRCVQGHCTLQR